ncbi:MAG: hypothetical protein R2865_02445 [Deinococcales bacterium]
MIRKLLAFILISLVCSAYAQFSDFTINRVSQEDLADFEEALATSPDGKTGMSKGMASDTLANQRPEEVTLAEELAEHQFHLNDYVIMCFMPESDMYVRLVDTKPKGGSAQLYPAEGSVAVEAHQRYCIGDSNSDVLVYADEGTGLGKGTLYLLGVKDEADFPEIDSLGNTPVGKTMAWLG